MSFKNEIQWHVGDLLQMEVVIIRILNEIMYYEGSLGLRFQLKSKRAKP